MNNKDLFNAINDIDEKFIEDAAKYLNDDDGDDPLHPRAIEIFPGEARFPVIKLVASIAAAAVFITGVTFAVKHYRGKMGIAPNAAASDNTAASGGGEANPNPDLGTHAVTKTGPLPFELIGPDDKQLWYEDIAGYVVEDPVNGSVKVDVTEAENATVELSEDNWESVACRFAYFALPSGCNYNSIDDGSAADVDPDFMMMRGFRRIYAGNAYGDLTVKAAYSQLTRTTFTNPETGETSEVTYLSENYIEFDGETTAEVYIVNDFGNTCCIFRNGADNFPIVVYDMPNYLELHDYSSKISTFGNKNGFKYAGDMPVMWLNEDEKALVEPYLSNATYLKATVTFTNVKLSGTQHLASTGFDINADIAKIVLNYVEPVETAGNMHGETPFDIDTELRIYEILGTADDVLELKSNEELMILTGCDNIRVYSGIGNMAGMFGEEIIEGYIAPGMVIELRGGDGSRIAAYKCREAILPE